MNNPCRQSSPGRSPLASPARHYFRFKPVLLLLVGICAVFAYQAWRAVSAAENLTINTVAGSSSTAGLAADFQSAGRIATTSDGNTIYVADTGNHVIRRISLSTSTVDIVAGTLGQSGFQGEGVDAKTALLSSPADVTLDAAGTNIFIADTGNNRIRKVNLGSGLITTAAGSTAGGQDGAIATATFNQPQGVAVDSAGNIYVADTANHRVRKITVSNNTVSTLAGDQFNEPGFAGDGTAASNSQLTSPRDVAVDSFNNRVYIADSGNHRIRVIQGLTSGDTINTFAGTGNTINNTLSGAATSVDLNNPTVVSLFEFNGGSQVYISDTGKHLVRRVNSTTGQLDTIAGSGTQGFDGDGTASGVGARSLNVPTGLAIPSTAGAPVYLMDSGNRRVRSINIGTNQITTLVSDGSSGFAGDGASAVLARLNGPRGIAVDAQGNFYIADTNNHVIRKVTKNDGVITTIAGQAGQAGSTGDGGQAVQATLNNPADVAVDSSGNIYISDTGNNLIRRVDQGGIITTITPNFTGVTGNPAGAKFISPQGLAVDSAGNLLIANAGANNIVRMGPTGSAVILAGSENALGGFTSDGPQDAKSALFRSPAGIDVDADGNVYVADTLNHKVRVISFSNGSFMVNTLVSRGLVKADYTGDGNGARFARLDSPTDVAIDATGSLYIADRGNNRLRKVTPNASGKLEPLDSTVIIDTVANSLGTIGFSGDGGQAINAALGLPYRMAYSSDGLYITDTNNNRIRRLTAPPNSDPTLAVKCSGNTCPNPVTVNEGQTVTISLQGTDPDSGQTLTYTFSETGNQTMTGAAVSPATGATSTFSWTPGFNVAPNQTGGEKTFNVKFKVTDNGSPAKFAEQTVTIKVVNVNQAPTASITTPASDTTIEATGPAGISLALAGTASDPDSDSLTIQWSDGLTVIAGATTLTPTVSLGIGSHSLKLTVNDGKGQTFTTAARTVNVVDTTPPVFTAVPADISVPLPQGQTSAIVNYTLPTVSDTVSGNCTINGNPCALTVTPADKLPNSSFPAGETVVTFKATDGAGNMATVTFKVVVGTGGSGSPVNYKMGAFAGSGNFGNAGSGGPAVNASFKRPAGIAVDSAGNVFVADSLARIIRKVNASDKVISNYAGTGDRGATGDGGQAVLAKLDDPNGLALDAQGNLYIADTGNHVIRRVAAATGLISTVAGSFSAGFSGDNGLATQAKLNSPTSVAVDGSGNLYIADTNNHRIRRVDAATGLMTTIAGTFIAGFSGDGGAATDALLDSPTGVAVTSDGSTIYIADQRNHRVRSIINGQINTFAGTGSVGFSGDGASATAAQLDTPTSVAIDPDSNVLITDTGNDRIRRVAFSDKLISTVAGVGTAGNNGDGGLAKDAQLDTPTFLAIDRRTGVTRGEVYVADTGNNRVRLLTINNAPPVPTTIQDQTVRKDRTLDIPLSAADADGDPVTFSVVSTTNLSFLSIINANPSARTATLRVNPNGGNDGVYNIQIKATDSRQASTLTPQFKLTIKGNSDPVACIAGGAQVTISSGPITIVVDGRCSSDPDNDPLTYSWKEGATALGNSSTIAPTLSPGTHDITLTVSDGSLTNSFTQRIIVGGGTTLQAVINGPTSANSPNGSPVPVSFDGSSSTGNPTTFSWKVDSNSVSNSVTLNTSLSVGSHTIELTVGNGQTTSTATRQITVSTGGPTACIDGGATRTVTATSASGAQVTLTSACTQGSGPLTYEWTDGATNLGSTASISPTLAVGSHPVKLKVTDSQNRSSEFTQTVTVNSDSGGTPICGLGAGLYICKYDPAGGRQGQTLDVTLDGNGFQQGATVTFSGDGITTSVQSVTNIKIVVRVTIALNAPTGSSNTNRRIITIKNPDASTVSTGRVFSVYPK